MNIYTTGHSNHSIDGFVALLKLASVFVYWDAAGTTLEWLKGPPKRLSM
jgi:hypothetical protein